MSNLKIPRLINSRILFDKFVKIRSENLDYGDGKLHEYFTLITKADAINVLAVTSEGKLVLTEEYRHPTGKVLLGCPGGYIDFNEVSLEAAERELLEETGYSADNFKIVGSAYPYPGLSSQKIIFVSALNAKLISEPKLEPSEIIRTVLKSEDELRGEISRGIDVDGILCSALYFLGLSKRVGDK